MKYKYAIFIMLIAAVTAYVIYSDYLPPYKPIKAARINSNLHLPNDTQILSYENHSSFAGQGYLFMRLKIDDKYLAHLIQECIEKKYKKINNENLVSDHFFDKDPYYGVKSFNIDTGTVKDGYYRLDAKNLNVGKLNYSLTVIDIARKEITIGVCFP